MKNRYLGLMLFLLLLVSTPIIYADYQDPGLETAKGNIPGHGFTGFEGIDENVGTNEYVVWAENTAYVFPVAATLMNVSSSSANDDVGNTGAWNVTIFGLDGNYVSIVETVTLNGQAPVSTVNLFYRVNRMVIQHVGTAGSNVGYVYIGTGAVVAGKPTVIYNEVVPQWGISSTAIYTVPDGYTAYLKYLHFGTDTTKIIEASFEVRCLTCPDNGWRVDYHDHFSARTIVHNLPIPFPYPEHTDIKITARNSVGDAFCTVDAFFYLVEDGSELISQTYTVTGVVDIMSTSFMVFCGIAFITLGVAWITPDNKKAAFVYAFSVVFWIATMYQWAVDQAGSSSWGLMFVFLVPLTFCIVMFIEKNFYSVDDAQLENIRRNKPY